MRRGQDARDAHPVGQCQQRVGGGSGGGVHTAATQRAQAALAPRLGRRWHGGKGGRWCWGCHLAHLPVQHRRAGHPRAVGAVVGAAGCRTHAPGLGRRRGGAAGRRTGGVGLCLALPRNGRPICGGVVRGGHGDPHGARCAAGATPVALVGRVACPRRRHGGGECAPPNTGCRRQKKGGPTRRCVITPRTRPLPLGGRVAPAAPATVPRPAPALRESCHPPWGL